MQKQKCIPPNEIEGGSITQQSSVPKADRIRDSKLTNQPSELSSCVLGTFMDRVYDQGKDVYIAAAFSKKWEGISRNWCVEGGLPYKAFLEPTWHFDGGAHVRYIKRCR